MDLVLLVLACATLLVAGAGVVIVLHPRHRPVSAVELGGLAFLLGAVFISIASYLSGLIIRGPGPRWVVTGAGLTLGAVGLLSVRRSGIRFRWSFLAPRETLALAAILVVQTGLVAWLAYRWTLGWDGLLIWEFKARLAHLNGGVIPLSYFSDATRRWSHPEYPLFLPLTESWLYGWLGRPDQERVKLMCPLFYAATLGLLAAAGRRLGGREWKALAAPVLLLLVPLTLIQDGSASSGLADFPLGAYYLASLVYLLEYIQADSPRVEAPRLAGILGGALPWIKQEGAILWFCLVILAMVMLVRRRRWSAAWWIIIPGAFTFAAWQVTALTARAPQLQDFLSPGVETLWSNFWRVPAIARGALVEMMNWGHWGLLWALMLWACILCLRHRRRQQLLVILLTIALPVCAYLVTYIFSSWPSFVTHMETSFPRLLIHVSPAAVLMIVIAIPERSFAPRDDRSW